MANNEAGNAIADVLFDDIYQISSSGGTIAFSTNAINIAAAANSTNTINITSNVNWTISSDQTWLTISTTSGSGNTTITLTVQQNASNSV